MATENVDILIRQKGAGRSSRAVAGIGTAAQGSAKAVKFLQGALLTLGVGIGLAGAVRTIADFSQQMSTVRAITGATQEEFVGLRDEAKRLGATTRFSASQAADAMVFLGRAGFDTNEVLGAVGGTLQLAQAGALELGAAADIASNVLTGFRLEVDQTGRVVDVLALAANSGNTTVGQLGEAMKFVGPVAAGLGVQLESATAAVVALSDAGLQASLAGTGLRKILSTLAAPTATEEKILGDLGLTLDDVNLKTVGLAGALQVLRDAGADTTVAFQLFGDRGGPAFEVLSTSIPKVRELEEELLNAGGTAERISRIMDQNLNGALLATRSAVEAVVIAFGDLGAESFLTRFFFGLAGAIRKVADNLDTVLELAINVSPALALIIAPKIISGFLTLSVAITKTAASVFLLESALFPPLALILGITAAVAAAAGVLYTFRDSIRISSGELTTLGDVLIVLKDRFGPLFTELRDNISNFISGLVDQLNTFFGDWDFSLKNIILQTARAFDTLVAGVKGAIDTIKALMLPLLDAFEFAFGPVIDFIQGLFQKASEFLSGIINAGIAFLGPAGEVVADILNNIKTSLSESAFGVGLSDVVEAAKEGFALVGETAGVAFNAALEEQRRNGLENFAKGVLADAEKISQERGVKLFFSQLQAAGFLPGPVVPKTPGVPTPVVPETTEDPAARQAAQLANFKELTDQLKAEANFLRLSNEEREVQARLIDLSIPKLLEEKKITEAQAAAIEDAVRANIALARQSEIGISLTDRFVNSKRDLADVTAEVTRLTNDGTLAQEQGTRAILEATSAAGQAAGTFGGQLAGSIADLKLSFMNFGNEVGGILGRTFQGAEDAIFNFAVGARSTLKDLFRGIAEDLARLAIRAAILKPLASIIPVPGFSLGGVTAFAGGGLVSQPTLFNTNVGLLGEAGREAILPTTSNTGPPFIFGTDGSSVPLERLSNGILGVRRFAAGGIVGGSSGGGGRGATYNFKFEFNPVIPEGAQNDPNFTKRLSADLKRAAKDAMREVIAEERLPGNQLNRRLGRG